MKMLLEKIDENFLQLPRFLMGPEVTKDSHSSSTSEMIVKIVKQCFYNQTSKLIDEIVEF